MTNLWFKVPYRVVAISLAPIGQKSVANTRMVTTKNTAGSAAPTGAQRPSSASRSAVWHGSADVESTRVEEIAAETLESTGEMLRNAVASLEEFKGQLQKNTEMALVKLAYEIARKVIHREVKTSPDIVQYLAREVLRRAENATQVTLLCNARDLAALQNNAELIFWLEEHKKQFSFRPDSRVGRGGCVLETEHGMIDARIESQLAEIEHEIFDISPPGAD